jgi:hypothetical protein
MSTESKTLTVSPWLVPSVRLMQRFRMKTKLATMASLLIVPLLVVSYVQLATIVNNYRTTKLELLGVQVVGQLTDLATEVQQHRTAVQLKGKPEFDSLRAQSESAMGKSSAALDAFVKTYPELALTKRWSALRPDLQALVADTATKDAMQLFGMHSRAVDGLRQLAQYAGETSTLVLDPVGDTYFLQDVLVEQGIPWVEAVSATRAVGAAWLGDSADRAAHSASLATLVELMTLKQLTWLQKWMR